MSICIIQLPSDFEERYSQYRSKSQKQGAQVQATPSTGTLNYLPEWKIYLWKRLLLNSDGFDQGTVGVNNFMFFSDEEQMQLMAWKTQRMIGSTQQLYGLAAARRKAAQIDAAGQQSIDDDYYSFHPIKIMGALIELMDSEPRILSVTARLDKRYIVWYHTEKKRYEAMQFKKHLAGLGGHGAQPYKPNPKYMDDPLCGLRETIYKKTVAGQALTPDDFRQLAGFAHGATHDFLVLELKIHKAALQAKLDGYIDSFFAGDLVAEHNVRYYAPAAQRVAIYSVIQATTGEYGPKNRQLTMAEVCQSAQWAPGEEKHYRFLETMLSLERTGNIVINNIRKAEIVFSLVTHDDAVTTGNTPAHSADDVVSAQLKSGLLTLNKATDAFRLNDVEGTLNLTSREYEALLTLMTSKSYQATYVALIGDASKTARRKFGFVLKNLKTELGILPTASPRNEDIFENMKNHSYRLIG